MLASCQLTRLLAYGYLRDVQQRAKGNKFLQVKASFTGFEQTVTVGGIK